MPVAAKGSKSAFAAESRRLAKTKSINQRKESFLPHALRRQLGGFLLSPSKCKRYTVCHVFFLCRRLGTAGVRQFTSAVRRVLIYHRHTVNALLLPIFFPLPTCAIVVKLILCGSMVSALCFFSLHITLSQAAVFSRFCKLVYELFADSIRRRRL